METYVFRKTTKSRLLVGLQRIRLLFHFFFFFALRVLSQKALLTLSMLTAKLTSSSFTHTFLGQGQICFWET